MATRIASRRRTRRYPISPGPGSCVEFEYPMPNGRHYRLPLVDLSCSGMSFTLQPDEVPAFEAGRTMREATVRVGECMVRGDLVIMHVTPESETRFVCGALLYPTTDTDLLVLKSVVSGMEAAHSL